MGIIINKNITILLLLLCAIVVPFCSKAVAEVPVESKIKAAFVLNFARFTTLPPERFESSSAPLMICTVGVEGGDQAFAGVESKKIKGHPVVHRSLDEIDGPSSIPCHFIYMADVPEKSVLAYLKNSDSVPVVSIGEFDGFARQGGIIEFVKIKDRLSFKINNSRAKKNQIYINASLLDLAEEVY